MYFIFYRDTKGWLRSTIHHKPLEEIFAPTGEWVDDGEGEMVEDRVHVKCKYIDLEQEYYKNKYK